MGLRNWNYWNYAWGSTAHSHVSEQHSQRACWCLTLNGTTSATVFYKPNPLSNLFILLAFILHWLLFKYSLWSQCVSWSRCVLGFFHLCPSVSASRGPYMIEGSLEVTLQTIWTDGKHSQEKVRREKIRHLQLQVHFNYNYTALPATTCRSISGFALPSIIHSNEPLL